MTCLSVRSIPLRMSSKLCCGLGNLLGLIGRERSINSESEPHHANADLEGHESLGRRYCMMIYQLASTLKLFLENWILGETHVYDFDLWRFCYLSLSKIQKSECVASNSEQNCAIFVMTVYGGKQHAEIVLLAILVGNTGRVIRSKLISITCYRVKIDVNPFCFMLSRVFCDNLKSKNRKSLYSRLLPQQNRLPT